jgi:integrase
MATTRYQEGSLERVKRAKGPDVWVYRWREVDSNGNRVQRKKIIGDLDRYPTRKSAKLATENFRLEINAREERLGKMTVGEAWGHFQLHELRDPAVGRSATTINCYLDFFRSQILPTWKDVLIDDVKAVAVEKWLHSLDLAPGTKSKIRNLLHVLFNHLIRHELYTRVNPITAVRQSAKRLREPDVLTLEEMQAILSHITAPAVRVMVLTAAASGLRRSEWRGLKFKDLQFDTLWFNLRRGLVRKDETQMKTEASRKGLPMNPELAEVLKQWRGETPYPCDDDWVFASPFTNGERPYWPESALKDYVRPAAKKAGIAKRIGWHTFRHSFGTVLKASGEDVKTVQELMRHANSRITLDLYTQATTPAKRSALSQVSGLFVVPSAKTA